MRKNSGKLTMALLGLVLALLVGVFAGKDLIKESYYDSEMADGYKVVYEVASADPAIVSKDAEIIARRFRLLGASAVKTSIDGSTITAVVTGLSDIETKKTLMTRTGILSFRNSKDEMLMDGSVLADEMPLSVTTNGESTYIQIKVKDKVTFKEKTQQLTGETDKMMVLWVDYADGQSYEAESKKNIPAYLGAATVSAAIDSDCYITTHHSAAETKELVALVSSGMLQASITEKSFEPVEAENGKNAAGSAYWGIVIAAVIVCALLAFIYGVPGIVTGVMSLGYAAAFFKSNQLLGVVFNSKAIALFAMSIATGMMITVNAYEKARKEMLKGRNAVASYDDAFKSVRKASWEAAIAQIVIGLVITLFYRGTMLQEASCITAGGVCNLLFFILLNNKIVRDLNESNYLNKSLYRISEKDLPDVEKGETYEKQTTRYDISKYLNNKIALIIAVLLAACGCVVAVLHLEAGVPTLIAACVSAVLAALYAFWQYRRDVASITLAALAGFLAAAGASTLLLKGFSTGLMGMACAAAVIFLYLNELKNNYRVISREKINEEKLNRVVNESINSLNVALNIGFTAALAFDTITRQIDITEFLWLIPVFVAIVILTSLWLNETRKGNRKNRTRKSNKKELKENTIFGINEQR